MAIFYKSIDDIVMKKLVNFFPQQDCFIEVNPGKVILPKEFMEIGDEIIDLPVREDDIWLISYPRTGSTWAQEMIWLLGNKLNFEGAKKIQQIRVPLLELTALFSQDHHEWVSNSIGNSVKYLKTVPSPRFARSHLPLDLLPRQLDTVKPKIIYTGRNPKDLCVSFYHYCKLVHGLRGSFEDFCEIFITGNSPIGCYWNHVLPFWKRRHDSNILFIKYEDMKRNLPSIIQQCAEFLGFGRVLTEVEMEKMCEHLKFERMQSNPAVNLEPIINPYKKENDNNKNNLKFIRKGQIGDWKNYITPELSKKFDHWIALNTSDTDLEFVYE